MFINQTSRMASLSSGLSNACYFLTLTFPTWGALVATMYMLLEHGTFSLQLFRGQKG